MCHNYAGKRASASRRWCVLLKRVLFWLFVGAGLAWYVHPFLMGYLATRAMGTIREFFVGPAEWDTILSAEIPGNGAVKFGRRWREGRHRVEYCLRWQKSADVAVDYMLGYRAGGLTFGDSGPGISPRDPQLRATEDYKRIWLVARKGDSLDDLPPRVMATLDTTTGEFFSAKCSIVDAGEPLDEQLEGAIKKEGYPQWATPGGGILLSESH